MLYILRVADKEARYPGEILAVFPFVDSWRDGEGGEMYYYAQTENITTDQIEAIHQKQHHWCWDETTKTILRQDNNEFRRAKQRPRIAR